MLRRAILDGIFAPGQRLNELELSQSLGISRSPIREAFQSLAKEGIVTLVANRGAFVAEFDLREIEELYEVRNALEVEAARLAALRADEHDLSLLQQALAMNRLALGGDRESYPPDLDFHDHLVDSVRNPRLAREIAEVNQLLRVARARSGFVPERARAAYEEHVAIYEAIADGDPERAATEMRNHLNECLGNLTCLLMGRRQAAPGSSLALPNQPNA